MEAMDYMSGNNHFDTPVEYLPGVGPKTGKKLAKLGVKTIGDLLYFFPRKYLDYSDISTIADVLSQKSKVKSLSRVDPRDQKYGRESSDIKGSLHSAGAAVGMTEGGANGGEPVTIKARIVEIENKKTRRRGFTVTEAEVEDGTGTLKVVWFNQPYLSKMLYVGREIILHGKVAYDHFSKGYTMTAPDWAEKPKIVPVYRETDGVTSYYIAKIVAKVSEQTSDIQEFLPEPVISENKLLHINEAIKMLHIPRDMAELEMARERMAFDELFLISLRGQVLKQELKHDMAPAISINHKEIDKFISQLPFELTGDQKKAVDEILVDISKSECQMPNAEDEIIISKEIATPPTMRMARNDKGGSAATPMNRLLNGDVGSGKTVVAALAAFATIKAGHNVIIMAPTEILANQHWASLTKLFSPIGVEVELITSATRKKQGTRNNNQTNLNTQDPSTKDIHGRIFVGTHALLYMDEPVENVGLVVVDEQHRFGVGQRQAIRQISRNKVQDTNKSQILKDELQIIDADVTKEILNQVQDDRNVAKKLKAPACRQAGNNLQPKLVPHFLSMTATPIPRSLQLALFAELDVSVIQEKPANRKEIKTRVVDESHRQKAYRFIRAHVAAGRQVFIICPLIEDKNDETGTHSTGSGQVSSDELMEIDRKTVAGEYEKLSKNIFPDLRIGMLHGKMKSKEKDEIMTHFSNMELDILVSTSVVEVGVDIPNASIMMIEDAERFGLAQLHQFRGRVGRGEHQSFCFLFSNSESLNSIERLKIMEETSDGFKLAEFDLKNRGAGDIFGTEQSGFQDIKFADLSNAVLISKASSSAKSIAESDPSLQNHPELKARIAQFESSKHFE